MDVAILEPDDGLLEILGWLLQHYGHTIISASSRPGGTDADAARAAQVFITRDSLPGLDRTEVRALIAARGGRPTLVLTDASHPASVANDLGVPAASCFGLPLKSGLLVQRLASLDSQLNGD